MAATISPAAAPDALRLPPSRPLRRRLPAGPARQAASAIVLVLAWQALSQWVVDPGLLPSPLAVLGRALELTLSGELPRSMGTSLGRILVGYVTGAVLGIALGLVMGRLSRLEDLVGPTLGFVRSIPPIAFVPFSIILFGIGETSKYAIIVYLVFIVLALSTAAGVRETPRIRIRAAQSLGAGGASVLLQIVLPSAFPFILTGLRVALNLAFMAVVSAELIGARSGLGHMIMDSQTMMETDRMLVGILALGVLGAGLGRSADLIIARTLSRFTHRTA
jgi:ABC-type nitrate/sulfonate/bicarbonate transport system permease component